MSFGPRVNKTAYTHMADDTPALKWKKSQNSIRAIQLAFEFGMQMSEIIRREANLHGLSTSDQIRKIIQLEVKTPKRPRLTVSLSPLDYEQLGKRYGIDPHNQAAIRDAIRTELVDFCATRDKQE